MGFDAIDGSIFSARHGGVFETQNDLDVGIPHALKTGIERIQECLWQRSVAEGL